ncbi:MAG: CoA-binding protein [candidate division Zixibacteria bacterium]|nr:CoA-binding protein [candidate division Zixibacteria bacterium]
MAENPSDDKIKEILETKKVVAVVGLSPKKERASNDVASYLKDKGYKIIPVNPGHDEILGEKSYPSLSDIPEKVDIVDIFRRPEHTGPIVDEAISIDADVIWLQLGIRNDEAAQKALDAGKTVVQDKCMLQEHRKLL